jgi:SAM-dependent methyltransferase
MHRVFLDNFGCLSDREWLFYLVRSTKGRVVRGEAQLPGFPDEELQSRTVGNSGPATLLEAFHFYRKIKSSLKDAGSPVNENTRVLDFGCGWGRIYRFFLKDVALPNLMGTDVDPQFISLCRELFPLGNFQTNEPAPPTAFADNFFDLVFCYSVFSHLSESAHIAWVQEIARLLKPGGFLIATTWGRGYFDRCAELRRSGVYSHPHEQLLAQLFRNDEEVAQAKANYDAGVFFYCPTGGGGPRVPSFYGEACVPPGFIKQYWPSSLQLLEFDDCSADGKQAVIVARKPQ